MMVLMRNNYMSSFDFTKFSLLKMMEMMVPSIVINMSKTNKQNKVYIISSKSLLKKKSNYYIKNFEFKYNEFKYVDFYLE